MSTIYTGPGQGARLTQIALFKEIWIHSNKRSFITGMHLRGYMNTPYFLNIFAHTLSKAQNQYPHFKYLAQGISLLSPVEHTLWDQGTEEKRIAYALDIEERTGGKATADWGKLKDKAEEMKKLYKKKFPSTRNGILQYRYSPEEIMAVVGNLNKRYFESFKK